jgi:hypothetical protein
VHFARTAAVTAGALLALVASACTTHHSSPSPSVGPASSGPSAAAALATIAQVARGAEYTATYTADSSDNPPRSNIITAFRTSTRTRLDVTEATGHVLIQVDPTGTYTCNLPTPGSGEPSCLTLAGPGQPVPASVDPAGQALFTTTLDVLAQGNDITVATEPPRPAGNGIPAARCYAVIAAPAGGVSPGTYCFTTSGILTRAQFRSNVLQMSALSGAPVDADFALPVPPLPLGAPASSGAPTSAPASSGP